MHACRIEPLDILQHYVVPFLLAATPEEECTKAIVLDSEILPGLPFLGKRDERLGVYRVRYHHIPSRLAEQARELVSRSVIVENQYIRQSNNGAPDVKIHLRVFHFMWEDVVHSDDDAHPSEAEASEKKDENPAAGQPPQT